MWFSSSQRDMKESFSSAKMHSINIFLSFRCGLMRKCCLELFSSVQLLSRVWLFETPWTAARQASLSIANSQSLPKLMSTESVMPSNDLALCCPLLLLPSIFPTIRVFSNKSVLFIRWPKYWSFIRWPKYWSWTHDWVQHQSFQWILRTDFL